MRVRVAFWAILAPAILAGGGCEKKDGYRAELDLCYAASVGNLQKVHSLVARGVSVHATDSEGQTPLHNAAEGGHLGVAKLLIRCGARIDPPDNQGCTPAMLAMAKNRQAVVEYLVGEGAAVNLHLASYLGDTAQARSLIDAGAGVNAQDPDGRAPLHYAAAHGHLEVAKLLIGASAGLDSRIGRDEQNRYDPGETPLHCAVAGGHAEMVALLIDAGADTDGKNRRGVTPLCRAVEEDRIDMVKLLLAKGANPNAASEENYFCEGFPLGIAIEGGNIDIMEALIAGGADVNARDESGWGLLHVAVMEHDWSGKREAITVRMIEALAAHGADVNGKDEEGLTPLHCAACQGHQRAAELLLVKGAAVNARTVPDPNPDFIMWERDLGFRMGPGVTPLHEAVVGADPNMVNLLIAHGAEGNARDDSGYTPLHYAAARAGARIVELLIARGADVNGANDDGATPLVTRDSQRLRGVRTEPSGRRCEEGRPEGPPRMDVHAGGTGA